MDQKHEDSIQNDIWKLKPNSGVRFKVTNMYVRKSSSCNEDEKLNEKNMSQSSNIGLTSEQTISKKDF